MAMSTTLFAITTEVLAELEATPGKINKLSSKVMFDTYLWTTIPYFLSGSDLVDDEGDEDEDEGDEDEDEGDDDAHPLAPALIGTRAVPCTTLENGAFHVVPVDVVRAVSEALAAVDLAELKGAILDAELEEIEDGEVWEELEQLDLSEPDDVAAAVVKDVKGLRSFYATAAKSGLAVVLYTT